ncbi:MAG TPA: hypothetical protein PK708_05215 [Candidatus Competibacter sp.]|nr:hypothetical protein [Candidatus Competibacter sp.]
MSSNTPAFDPRLINPLICNPEDGPRRFAGDTLHRCASLLELFGRLIGSHDGAGDLFQEDDHAFAFHLQLEGIASTLRAVADALGEQKQNDKEGVQ